MAFDRRQCTGGGAFQASGRAVIPGIQDDSRVVARAVDIWRRTSVTAAGAAVSDLVK